MSTWKFTQDCHSDFQRQTMDSQDKQFVVLYIEDETGPAAFL